MSAGLTAPVQRPSPQAPHPVKTERHDTRCALHHTNTGVRQVEVYRPTAQGLFVARPFEAHPRIRFWQAHLLPALGLVLCRYDFHGPREHDYYLDVARITTEQGGEVWTVRDLYLDLVVHDGRAAEIVDTDELFAARGAGYLDEEEVAHAVSVAHHTLRGLARSRYSLRSWLAAEGLSLDWLGDEPPAGAHPS